MENQTPSTPMSNSKSRSDSIQIDNEEADKVELLMTNMKDGPFNLPSSLLTKSLSRMFGTEKQKLEKVNRSKTQSKENPKLLSDE